MKTKSKRFLNLATLCLALLGTTLLIEQPVKAEVVVKEVQQTKDSDIRKEYMERLRITDSDLEDQEHLRNRVQGYVEGYKEGYKEGVSQDPDKNLDVLKNKDYHPDNGQRNPYDTYSDGFDEGYTSGWNKANQSARKSIDEEQGSRKSGTGESSEQGSRESRTDESSEQGSQESRTDESSEQDSQESGTGESSDSGLIDTIINLFVYFLSTWFG
ncbi:Uncharacterised protein [Streptococcus pyogenes]|uniref:hypothetical protein n=1 Tax=Streptococcus pyogenes TaxID=1314 RepID=UPI0010D5D41F|nr:hypothetical protein [Streptococcus pyogenes]VHM89374.1 Uncharacterised protein [Streptococcus pyogenes]